MIYPILKDIENSSNEILMDKGMAVSINEQKVQLDNFKKKYNDYNYNLEKINQLFVDSKDPIDFIKFLEKTAKDSGISAGVKMDVVLSTKETDNLPVIISNISATGKFLDLLKFSEKLDASPYLMKIKNMTIKSLPKETMVDFNLSVEAITK
ncbi:MAG: hypothetical protein HY219_01160 [Candidatus Staskawiczbacteria bacterium]|nr:hypothetical protein [Candidatus Staskawiczbacteria bacterium]